MKLHLKDYSLISNKVLKEKLEYYEERNKREPSNSYIEGKMDLLKNLIGNHLIPSEKLAEMIHINNLIVLEVPEDAYDFGYDYNSKILYWYLPTYGMTNIILPNNIKILGKLSDLSEEECSRFVQVLNGLGEWKYYDYVDNAPNGFNTAKESLISLLQSKGIDTTKNLLLIEKS